MAQGKGNTRVIGGIYRLGAIMQSTGMLTICTANDRNTNTMVGLYLLEFPPSFSSAEVQRILQPVERLRSLHAPHVMRMHNWGIEGTRAYIATDPPRGVPLRYILDNENISLSYALDLITQITRGVLAFHTHGIIGIDLRPQFISIVVDENGTYAQLDDVGVRTILTTFGASATQQAGEITFRDPRYTAPEALVSQQSSIASDIYQIGILLFELVAGRLPFVGQTRDDTERLQKTAAIPRLRQFAPNAPDSLQAIVDRTLAKKPAQRYPDAQSLLTVLNTMQQTLLSTAQHAHASGDSHLTQEIAMLEDEEQTVADQYQPRAQRQEPLPPLPTPLGVYAYLCYKRKDGSVQHIPLLSEHVLIGRADPKHKFRPDIDLTIFDTAATVSRKHAIIHFDGQKFTLEDQKSMNKTRHGSRILTPNEAIEVHHGDPVRFGSVQMEFRIPGLSMPNSNNTAQA